MTRAKRKRNRRQLSCLRGNDVGLLSPLFSTRQMAGLCRRLESLTRGGIPFIRAVDLMAEGDSRRPVGRVLLQVANDMRRGATLGQALRSHPRRFPSFFIETVANGEITGDLAGVFGDLAAFYERNLGIQRAIIQQLLYPLCLLAFVLYLLPLFIIVGHTIVDGSSLDSVLPGYLLHRIGGGLVLPLLVLVILARLGVIRRLWRVLGPFAWPVSQYTRQFEVAYFLRSLAILLSAGFHVLTAMERSANVLGNNRMRRQVLELVPAIEQGQTLGETLGAARWLPSMAREMLTTGERSGQIGEMLTRASDQILEETYHKLRTMLLTLELFALFGVGAIGLVF
jgi:type II secretory pathway component PulF